MSSTIRPLSTPRRQKLYSTTVTSAAPLRRTHAQRLISLPAHHHERPWCFVPLMCCEGGKILPPTVSVVLSKHTWPEVWKRDRPATKFAVRWCSGKVAACGAGRLGLVFCLHRVSSRYRPRRVHSLWRGRLVLPTGTEGSRSNLILLLSLSVVRVCFEVTRRSAHT